MQRLRFPPHPRSPDVILSRGCLAATPCTLPWLGSFLAGGILLLQLILGTDGAACLCQCEHYSIDRSLSILW